ncbi:MAG: hypothetical protein WC179_05100 [Candidatus Cloacimonadaceae bacterium]
MSIEWSYSMDNPREPTEDDYGFIYQIDYNDGTSYIGKKNLWIREELPPLKSGKKRQNVVSTIQRNYKNKRVTMDIVLKPSNWKKYVGSSKLTDGKVIISKNILAYAPTKRYLTYLETKAIMCLEALENDTYLNENCLGKFFKDNLI